MFAMKGAIESTILLKNENDALPHPMKEDWNNNFLVIGSTSLYPIIAGGGSGEVHVDVVYSPLNALAD